MYGTEWFSGGENIEYGMSRCVKTTNGGSRGMFCLSFKIILTHPWDKVFLAPSIPYTYSTLINHIGKMKEACLDAGGVKTLEVRTLCKTLAGIEVPLLVITNFDQS